MTGDDMSLLKAFVAHGDEAAFSEIVQRHIALVQSAAWRQTNDKDLTQEVTQAVFIILSRKAASLGADTVLSAWLYRATRFAAADALKIERRRRQREQEAFMQSTPADSTPDVWNGIAPYLDEAMASLSEPDRTVLVLKYFENKTAAEIATVIHAKEEAAQKQAARALDKLRKLFLKRGVALSATALGSAIATNSVQAATSGLAETIAAAAAKNTIVSSSLTTLVETTLKTMNWLKIKFALGVSSIAVVVISSVSIAVSQIPNGSKPSGEEILRKTQEAYSALKSYRDEGRIVATLMETTVSHTFTIKLSQTNFYRIEWEQSTEANGIKTPKIRGAVWSDGTGDFLEMLGKTRTEPNLDHALATATGISGGAAATIPGMFFSMKWSTLLSAPSAGPLQQPDESVGGVDCYVVWCESKGRKRTLWIGKNDFLIRKVQTVTSSNAMKEALEQAARSNPAAAAKLPKMQLSDSTSTETHENIVVNLKISASEFQK